MDPRCLHPGVVSNGIDNPTPLGACLDIALTSGTTQGFYITTTSGGIRYTTGTGVPVGTLYTSNAELDGTVTWTSRVECEAGIVLTQIS